MIEPGLTCRDEQRRHKVRAAKEWNGLDYLEVSEDQRSLSVFFLDKAPQDLRPENVVIRPCGGADRTVRVTDLRLCVLDDEERDDCLHLTLDAPGGFSLYKLCLVEVDETGWPTDAPFHGFDPRYACLEFSFKIGCASGLDCKEDKLCPPEPRTEPEINYLAKDYSSFRQLILDRLALTLPDWQERHVPDLGIALVEVLAYVGDHLSYTQDAVATEAYLDTARRRISVRRHVRLVDYPMHEGCNARAWVFVETTGGDLEDLKDFWFITGFQPAPPAGKALKAEELLGVPREQYLVFEPVREGAVALREAHNEIDLNSWGDRECCLPVGTTRATLKDEWLEPKDVKDTKDAKDKYGYEEPCDPEPPKPPRGRRLKLKAGDLLLFEEVMGPKTGHPANADPGHRHVVRLTRVEEGVDELYDQPVLEIEWAREDALPFPLCVSSIGGEDCRFLPAVSVARGNILLVDHGRTETEDLDPVKCKKTPSRCEGEGRLAEVAQRIEPFEPPLKQAPLTFRQPVPEGPWVSAARLMRQDPRQALPEVELGEDWKPVRDLLASGPDDAHFAVEVDDDGRAHLRFGDDELGEAPRAGTAFKATYRAGNGRAGNVGAESIRHLVLRNQTVPGVNFRPRNPLLAQGGTDPEPLADVRLLAPHAFRKDLQRAVIAEDYARLVERDFAGRVQKAAAVLRWTGSWPEALVVVDPVSQEEDVDRLLREIRRALHKYRRIGHDLVVKRAVSVGLDVELSVCVRPHYLRGHVQAALLEVLGNRALPDGRRGFFHPDNLTFGEGIVLSKLIAAAHAVTGVESVAVTKFERLHEGPDGEIETGFLPLGPLEIARLDNDRSFPDHGRIKLTMRGGR